MPFSSVFLSIGLSQSKQSSIWCLFLSNCWRQDYEIGWCGPKRDSIYYLVRLLSMIHRTRGVIRETFPWITVTRWTLLLQQPAVNIGKALLFRGGYRYFSVSGCVIEVHQFSCAIRWDYSTQISWRWRIGKIRRRREESWRRRTEYYW